MGALFSLVQAVFDYIAVFIDYISAVVMLVVNSVQSAIWFIVTLPRMQTTLLSSFAYAPSIIQSTLLVSATLLIILGIIKLLP